MMMQGRPMPRTVPGVQPSQNPPDAQSGYPSGGEIVQAEQQGKEAAKNIENPVLAGFRAIMGLIGKLQEKGDPRAEAAASALRQLLDSLAGAPMEPPQGTRVGEQAAPPQAGMPGAPAAPGAGMPPQPPSPASEGPNLVSEFEQQESGPAVRPRPMGPITKPQGKRPVVLT